MRQSILLLLGFLQGVGPVGEYVEVTTTSTASGHRRGPAAGGVPPTARLDCLFRNAGFRLALRDLGVGFVCCDMPDASTRWSCLPCCRMRRAIAPNGVEYVTPLLSSVCQQLAEQIPQ
jgi:hypothetical protein